MPDRKQTLKLLTRPALSGLFLKIYGDGQQLLKQQQTRYAELVQQFSEKFGDADLQLFSTPGRTEIGGNHTDHNNGRVLAGSVNLDSIAVAAKTGDNKITLYSAGYRDEFTTTLDMLEPQANEQGTTESLLRGIAARIKQLGYEIGGFNACLSSDVMVGSGLSSSASIEVLIGTILNAFYNDGKISAEQIATIGQYAENEFFGKPCGLMDQMTCAVGNIVTIDFKDTANPIVRKINFDFNSQDYNLLVLDTGGNHADLTDDYASIPAEMKSVAQQLGAEVGRELTKEAVYANLKTLREKVGDRAILRILHFLADNERVEKQVAALEQEDFETFLEYVTESGNSSFRWLQNCYPIKLPEEQGVSLALNLTEDFLKQHDAGACRVHGGGFAGTIQVFMKTTVVPEYVKQMERVFGENSVLVLNIRSLGTIHINALIA